MRCFIKLNDLIQHHKLSKSLREDILNTFKSPFLRNNLYYKVINYNHTEHRFYFKDAYGDFYPMDDNFETSVFNTKEVKPFFKWSYENNPIFKSKSSPSVLHKKIMHKKYSKIALFKSYNESIGNHYSICLYKKNPESKIFYSLDETYIHTFKNKIDALKYYLSY